MFLKLVSAKIPEGLIDGLDELVSSEMYPSRSAAIRAAVRDLLKRELWNAPSRHEFGSERKVHR